MKAKRLIRSLTCLGLSAAMLFTAVGCNKEEEAKSANDTLVDSDTYEDGTAISSRVSVHDPSIVVGEDPDGNKCYYIFGSHRAWAKSYDLMNWTSFTNNINHEYRTMLADAFAWSANGDNDYNPSGNMWAPDVIWNDTMNKWCMYLSINGSSWNSSIVLLTADNLEGDWTYEGTVIYSGFNADGVFSYTQTDYAEVTGDTDFSVGSKRYVMAEYVCEDEGTTWNTNYGAHAIDPCVVYDTEGNLYMSYGSWSGGIFMIELDETTGLRDTTVTYENASDYSTDAYMGIKLAGGLFATGEASYIQYDEEAGYYYLYVTYGGLTADGGYNIRLFRSEDITGPYVDTDGTLATKATSRADVGVKLFGNYCFSSFKDNGTLAVNGYKSGGHNSAFIDDDGNRYLIYHTRYNSGTENHEVRVHQQFLNEDGWLVTAVYEYLGSEINEAGYTTGAIIGDYEMVNMGSDAATANVGMLTTYNITLNADGTVTGDYTGTWEEYEVDGKAYYASITINEITYKGVFFKQYDESASHTETMTFTCLSETGVNIWGSKVANSADTVYETSTEE